MRATRRAAEVLLLLLLSKLINFHIVVLDRAESSVNGSVKTQIKVSKMHYSCFPSCKFMWFCFEWVWLYTWCYSLVEDNKLKCSPMFSSGLTIVNLNFQPGYLSMMSCLLVMNRLTLNKDIKAALHFLIFSYCVSYMNSKWNVGNWIFICKTAKLFLCQHCIFISIFVLREVNTFFPQFHSTRKWFLVK